MNKTIQKYLSVYAEVEQQTITKLQRTYNFVIVIPICNEPSNCLKHIFKNIQNDSVLIILVVNSPEKHLKYDEWQVNNSLFINKLIEKHKLKSNLSHNIQLLQYDDDKDLLIVDRNTLNQQIPLKKGVGLARKIGADIALRLYVLGGIKTPWIVSTDADVVLPEAYFKQTLSINSNNYSAIVNEFEHISDTKELNNCQFLYDTKLRYYQAGVQYAGIAYDYVPLGSTLIVNTLCYAQVRGFPQKSAGEDFYILNKLAKIKPVFQANTQVVIKARFSDRVPFGTGPALTQIKNIGSYLYYNPKCFMLLKLWIAYLKKCWKTTGLEIKPPKLKELTELYHFLNCENVFKSSKPQITTELLWTKFIHQWFDAFKTLKAVHFFDKQLPRLNFQELLKQDSFDKLNSSKLSLHLSKQNHSTKPI